jgi:hypothetical protein
VGAALQRQMNDMRGTAETLTALGATINETLQLGIGEMTAASDRAAGRVEEIGQLLADQGRAVDQASAVALQRVVERTAEMQQRAELIQVSAEEAGGRIEAVTGRLGEQSRIIVAAGDGVSGKLREVGGQFRQQVQELANAVEQTVGRMQGSRDLLNEYFAAIADATGAVAARLQELGEAARNQVTNFAAVSDAMGAHREEVGTAVRRQLLELSGTLEQANARLEAARAILREQANELNGATDLAVERLSDVSDIYHHQSTALIAAADRAGSRAKEASELFTEQTQSLLKAAHEATELAQRARDAAVTTQQDSFLRGATFIIETLQSLSVDLTRVLDQPVPDSVWKRFHAGERGIFARHILALQERQANTIIKQKFEQDGSFRDQVLRYLDQFENLLAQARSVDHLDVLGATFVTADVGKLYLVLSNAVGRMKPQ